MYTSTEVRIGKMLITYQDAEVQIMDILLMSNCS